jgi:WD40 repeat protein
LIIYVGYENSPNIAKLNSEFLDTESLGQLVGHTSMITSLALIEKTPMLVSVDDKFKIKLWDLRDLKCI